MTSPQPVRALFRCDGASVPAGFARHAWDVDAPITSRGHVADLNLKAEPLAAKVVGAIDGHADDLVRIAAYAYAADQMVSRGGPVDVHREAWRRQLALCIPVSDPGFWSEAGRLDLLREVFGFLTEDAWEFAFERGEPAVGQLPLDLPGLPPSAPPDAVALFSGGTDSLCAIVEAVAAGARPLVVSHRPAAQFDRWQRDRLDALRCRFPGWRFPQLSFWVHRRGSDPADSAQRTRAFLFAALGAAAAGQAGIPTVLLPDNGYVSLNPPISGQLVGALASRSTHPTFLRLFNRLLENAFPARVRLANPLGQRTRAEALRALEPAGCADLLGRTHSCGKHRGRPTAQPHCGGCSQCVDRRFASVAAGLEAHDPAERYGRDVFTDELPEGEPRTIAESYVRFARATRSASDDELFASYPQLIAALDSDDPNLGAVALGLADLLRRHAEEVRGLLDVMISRRSTDLAAGTLPDRSLLRLVTGPGSAPRDGASAGDVRERPEPDEDENAIEHRHGVWHVRFRGTKGTYPHSTGMERLARLLAAPDRGIGALQLKTRAAPRDETGATSSPSVPLPTEDDLRPAEPGALGEVIDAKAERELKERAGKLAPLLADARERGDEGRIDQLLHELDWIEGTLRAATAGARSPMSTNRRAKPCRRRCRPPSPSSRGTCPSSTNTSPNRSALG